jgi:heme oxygenase
MRLRNAPDVSSLLAEWMQNYLLHEFLPELNLPRSANLDELVTLLPERFSSWQKKIEQEAREAALLKGKQEGMSEGGIRLLQRQLTRRFGPLPGWVQQRLQHAALDELETWLDRVLDAQRLEDVFEK